MNPLFSVNKCLDGYKVATLKYYIINRIIHQIVLMKFNVNMLSLPGLWLELQNTFLKEAEVKKNIFIREATATARPLRPWHLLSPLELSGHIIGGTFL